MRRKEEEPRTAIQFNLEIYYTGSRLGGLENPATLSALPCVPYTRRCPWALELSGEAFQTLDGPVSVVRQRGNLTVSLKHPTLRAPAQLVHRCCRLAYRTEFRVMHAQLQSLDC